MHLGGNYRRVPLSKSFENNNDNKKRYRAQKFYFTISSAVSSIQLHSGGQILLFSWAENSHRPSPVWTTYYGVRRCQSKQISLVESRTFASGWTNNVTAAETANVRRIRT